MSMSWELTNIGNRSLYAGLLRSDTQSCPTPCDPMDCSTPGFPVLHYLPEIAQTYVHWANDVIQPSHPLSSHSPPALNLSLSWIFASGGQSIGASTSVLPMNIQGWFPLGWTGLMSLRSKGFSRVFSSTTVRKHWRQSTCQQTHFFDEIECERDRGYLLGGMHSAEWNHPFLCPSLFRNLVFNLSSLHNKIEAEMSLPTTTAELSTGEGLWSDSWQIIGLAQHLSLARVERGARETLKLTGSARWWAELGSLEQQEDKGSTWLQETSEKVTGLWPSRFSTQLCVPWSKGAHYTWERSPPGAWPGRAWRTHWRASTCAPTEKLHPASLHADSGLARKAPQATAGEPSPDLLSGRRLPGGVLPPSVPTSEGASRGKSTGVWAHKDPIPPPSAAKVTGFSSNVANRKKTFEEKIIFKVKII